MSNNLNSNAMENKVTIKQQLNAIVFTELNGLVKVVDEWFKADEDRTELVLGTSANDAPIINLYTEDNDPVQYYVKGVAGAYEGYYLELIWTQEPFDDKHIRAHYLEGDRCNAWEFIPGELDRLTDEVLKAIHPEEKCYQFDDYQKTAIDKFNEALKELSKAGVFILPHEEDKTFYFATAPRGCLFDSFDNLLSTGEYEKVADIDYHKLPYTDSQYDTSFDSDGISLIKEA